MSADSRFRDAALFYVLALGMAVGVTALTPALNLYDVPIQARQTPFEIGRASLGKECRSRWSPYH